MTETIAADHVGVLTGIPASAPEPRYEIVGGYLVEVVDEHTCGAGGGSGAGHEPYCGTIPVASVKHIFELLKVEADKQAAEWEATHAAAPFSDDDTLPF